MSLNGTPRANHNVHGSINSIDVIVISAYDTAVKKGFDGTEEEWLASLKGDKGDPYSLTEEDKADIAALVTDGEVLGNIDAALDAILAIQESLIPKKSTFTVRDNDGITHTYEFEEGMTWSEWVADTKYNTEGFIANGFGTVSTPNGMQVWDGSSYVSIDSLITANFDYSMGW